MVGRANGSMCRNVKLRSVAGCGSLERQTAVTRGGRHGESNSHLARVYAGGLIAMSISSSQLISRSVAAAGRLGVQGRVARVLVQEGEVRDGRRMVGRGLGRRGHSRWWEA